MSRTTNRVGVMIKPMAKVGLGARQVGFVR